MSKILVTSLEKSISTELDDRKTRNEFNKIVEKFIDVNVEVLQDSTPQYRLFFTDTKDRDPIYNLFSINKDDIDSLVEKIPNLNSNWKVATNPFFILMTLIIRDLSKSNNDKRTLTNALLYLTFSMYSSLQFKYFRDPPNADIINYTINNASNKFLFKSYGSVLKALLHTAEVNHNKYKNMLLREDDKDIISYLVNLRNRLNGLVQNFKNAYETNRKNKKYLTHETDSNEEENYKETTNLSIDITKKVSELVLKFFTASIDENLVKISAVPNNINRAALYNTISLIKEKESDLVREIISYIIEIFLTDYDGNTDILKSKKFIVDGIGIYSRSNTKDSRILRSKEILEIFLEKYCKAYMTTERALTKNNYKKALFSYFVFFIAYNA